MTIMKTIAAATVAALVTAGAAQAVTFSGTFEVGGDALVDPGLVVSVDPNPGPVTFDLDVGDSVTFDLFDIWTEEDAINFDDLFSQDIFVAFNFTAPPPPFAGTVTGDSGLFFGFLTAGGEVEWDGTETVNFGPNADGVLELSLSDETFNVGLFGLNSGQANGATVQLTATYVSEPSPIPLPAAGWMLLLGVGGMAAVRRKAANRA